MPSGIIMKGIGGFYYVKTAEKIYECKARGVFRKSHITPLPGDRVEINIIDEEKALGNIQEIIPRNLLLVRPAVANVDQVAVVMAVKSPEPDFVLVDKMLITAEMKGINAIICINKTDLGSEEENRNTARIYESAGYDVVLLSSKENRGLEGLRALFKRRMTVFAGQSGVGKSTILNSIKNMSVMQTGNLSIRNERGKHTTRHAELFQLDSGGYVVDTPGFSSFELADVEYRDLQHFYPEFREHIAGCRFTGCSHISEPDCCVKNAVETGLADASRYERYIGLYNLLKESQANIYKKR